jgi:hypothetical protein
MCIAQWLERLEEETEWGVGVDWVYMTLYSNRGRYSDGLRAGQPGFDSQQGARDFFLFDSFQTGSGAHPVSSPMGNGVEGPCREADHSPPSSAEVKNIGAIPPLPDSSS